MNGDSTHALTLTLQSTGAIVVTDPATSTTVFTVANPFPVAVLAAPIVPVVKVAAAPTATPSLAAGQVLTAGQSLVNGQY